MIKKIVIPYFSVELKYLSPVLFIVAIYLAWNQFFLWTALLSLIGILLCTTNYVTEIDLQKRIYSDYLSMLGFKLNNESSTFTRPDRIVISKGNYAHTVNTRIQSRTMQWSDFTGTLIFDEGKTLNLITRNDKTKLIAALKEFADFLDVSVIDQTTNDPYVIDLSGF